jgi:hypothetical protein
VTFDRQVAGGVALGLRQAFAAGGVALGRRRALAAGGVALGRRRAFAAFAAVALPLALGACSRPYRVGDRVLVEWEGDEYPASVLVVESPGRFRVHYEGMDSVWDESVPATRIKGRVSGTPRHPPPPSKVRARGAGGAQGAPPSLYKVGDRVKIDWKGAFYPGTVVAVLGGERYRVHYDGYDANWEENVDLNRLQRK